MGHCPIYRQAALEGGAHPEGVKCKEEPEEGAGEEEQLLLEGTWASPRIDQMTPNKKSPAWPVVKIERF